MVKSIFAFVATVGLVIAQPSPPETPAILIRSSQYIFEGTVEKLGASNVNLLPASERTALVRVKTMLRAPKGMNFSDRDITLYLLSARAVKPGESAVFFANGWLYGQDIAMREAGRLPAAAARNLKASIVQVDAQVADEGLLARLREADLVIQGRVLTTRVVRDEVPKRSEHETGWALAQVQLSAVLKGQVPAGTETVPVYFPISTDEAWYLSHKFSAGEQGVFLLSAHTAKVYKLDGYTALGPYGFLTGKDSERASALSQRLH